MDLKISIPSQSIDSWKQSLADKLEIAIVKGWEAAVERVPAAGETTYSTGQLRQSLRFRKINDFEYEIVCPMGYGAFLEFGTGPRGQQSGALADFPNDPQPGLLYHTGEVWVTRSGGRLLDEPYVRHTLGMAAQPFLRPGLMTALETFMDLLNK